MRKKEHQSEKIFKLGLETTAHVSDLLHFFSDWCSTAEAMRWLPDETANISLLDLRSISPMSDLA